ncbi:MAG: D-glycero-beta-D-manno-heptose 1-phosphate adenylyltransferase [Phycisphaeraceae bacterium]|nr:MAG: D-glycero-beta-D-manno-heptose 1-phosphate adenylyltransferase [Phycisphaeraceae bacterium]
MGELLAKLAAWRPFTALVVGDFMLDQLVYGDAERMSPDAPVPVLRVHRTEALPGGAANVCLDIVALRGRVIAFGVTGEDAEGATLREALGAGGVDTNGLITDSARPTTVKRSLVGLAQHRHPQKMFRMDMESTEPLSDGRLEELLRRFDAALADADVVCIEDYNKGVCCERLCCAVIERCRSAGKPVIVDPALIESYERYRGATAITPNRTEAELATGRRVGDAPASVDQIDLAVTMARGLDLEALVLTLDRHGALLVENGGEADVRATHLPTVARQVYDVTGAGDMVLAALAAARANGTSWPDAVRFANAAAGLEVEIFGVKPIPLERVHHALLVESRKLLGKERTLEEAAIEAAALRREGKTIVFTNGCFDILHAGHVSLLRKAARMGDALVVGINSDASVRRLKGPDRPVHHEQDRIEILSELESVDMVIVFDDETPLKLIEAVKPDVLVKGADYTRDRVVGADLVESWGGRVELAPLLEGRSTSGVVSRMRSARSGSADGPPVSPRGAQDA